METSTLGVDALLSVRERFTLKGKRAVVTGCPGGIGRASASAFADLGADVPIADIAPRQREAGEVAEPMVSRYGVLATDLAAFITGEDILVDGRTTVVTPDRLHTYPLARTTNWRNK